MGDTVAFELIADVTVTEGKTVSFAVNARLFETDFALEVAEIVAETTGVEGLSPANFEVLVDILLILLEEVLVDKVPFVAIETELGKTV